MPDTGISEAHPVSVSPTAARPVNISPCNASCDAAARQAYHIPKRVSCVACNPALNGACHHGIFKADFIVIRIAGSLIETPSNVSGNRGSSTGIRKADFV